MAVQLGHCRLTGHWVPGHWSFCLSQAVPLNRLTFYPVSTYVFHNCRKSTFCSLKIPENSHPKTAKSPKSETETEKNVQKPNGFPLPIFTFWSPSASCASIRAVSIPHKPVFGQKPKSLTFHPMRVSRIFTHPGKKVGGRQTRLLPAVRGSRIFTFARSTAILRGLSSW